MKVVKISKMESVNVQQNVQQRTCLSSTDLCRALLSQRLNDFSDPKDQKPYYQHYDEIVEILPRVVLQRACFFSCGSVDSAKKFTLTV